MPRAPRIGEDFDGNNLINTVTREVKEELGINVLEEQITKILYSFKFIDKEDVEKKEYCFGIILSLEQKKNIKLSEEHDAVIYSKNSEYLKSMLKFEENKIGLGKFIKWTKKGA